MPSTIEYEEVYKVYQKVDLMRAKYRHADLTTKAWCFHGNQVQGWAGGACSGGRMIGTSISRGASFLSPSGINVIVNSNPWLSLRMAISIGRDESFYGSISGMGAALTRVWMARAQYVSSAITENEDKIYVAGILFGGKTTSTLTYEQFRNYENELMQQLRLQPISVTAAFTDNSDQTDTATFATIAPANTSRTMVADVRTLTDATTIKGVRFTIVPPDTFPTSWRLNASVEYIKFDVRNIFGPLTDEELAITTDFNALRQEVEVFNKADVAWENPEPVSANSRVKQYVDVIKRADIDQAMTILNTAAPYNGCASCDTFTCTCNGTNHGGTGCSTCNGCNAYSSCSCNSTTHGFSSSCSCNGGVCHGYTSSCSCNGPCYGYQAGCDRANAGYYCSCNASEDGENSTCNIQMGQTGNVSACSACHTTSNAWCMATNAACGVVHDDAHCTCNKSSYIITNTCKISCYSGYTASYCSTCNWQVWKCPAHAVAGTCSCQGSYSTSTCSCESSHGYTSSCTCNGLCYGYQGCSACNSCNGYTKCSCDVTCHGQACAQCHSAFYSTMA